MNQYSTTNWSYCDTYPDSSESLLEAAHLSRCSLIILGNKTIDSRFWIFVDIITTAALTKYDEDMIIRFLI